MSGLWRLCMVDGALVITLGIEMMFIVMTLRSDTHGSFKYSIVLFISYKLGACERSIVLEAMITGGYM